MSDIGPVVPPSVPPATTPAAGSTPPASPSPQPVPQQHAPQQPAPQQPAPQQSVPPSPTGQAGGQPPPNPQQPPAATPTGADPAAQISAALRELAQGGQITATVVARDQAALLVRTAAGATLALNNLAAALEQANVAVLNAALKLQLNPASPNQATVTHANGASLQPPLQAMVQPPSAAQMQLAASPPLPSAALPPASLPQPGQTLSATVTAPPPAPAAASGATPPPMQTLPPGSQLQLVVKSVSPPASVQQPAAPAPVAPQAAAPTAPTATPAAPPVAQAPVSPLPNVALETRPTLPNASPASPQPPAAASPAAMAQQSAAPRAMPPQITGIVSGQGQPGQVPVSTPQGVLSLSLPQPLPPGTQISFELAALVRPSAQATQVGPAPLAGVLSRLQGEWPVLQQTLDALRAADPALAQRLQADLLPQPNARLASTALQFMAAAAIGSAQAWLGAEAARKLEQAGRSDLLRRLDDDFRELGRLNQRQGDSDWQALVMPMLVGGRVEPIHIFMRRRRDPKRQQQQTRFIIDFDLESTGPIQFDGFVGAKQLDLILRSESEFGPAFRLDVTEIFTSALEVTGMTGSIRFHDREKPLAWPSPELEAAGPSTEVKA